MDEVAVRLALKSLIVSNQEELVDGLVVQGRQKYIEQITTAVLSPVRDYYFMRIVTLTPTEHSRPGQVNAAVPATTVNYPIQMLLADAAVLDREEDELYEAASDCFITLGDRIVNLILDTAIILGPSDERYRLQRSSNPDADRAVSKANLVVPFTEAEEDFAILVSEITFTLAC